MTLTEEERVALQEMLNIDYEYVRKGTANLFVHYDVHAGWRHVAVTDQRTSCQFAHQMKELVDRHYPQAECIRIFLDNVSSHTAAALYDTFELGETRRILRRLEFHLLARSCKSHP